MSEDTGQERAPGGPRPTIYDVARAAGVSNENWDGIYEVAAEIIPNWVRWRCAGSAVTTASWTTIAN